MRKIYFYCLTLITLNFAYVKAQQEAKITVKGNKHKQSTYNDISITQQANDSIQKATVELEQASKNKLKINQGVYKKDSVEILKTSVKDESIFKDLRSKTEVIIGILMAIVSFIVYCVKSYRAIKKRKK
ncbi:hypothetical protein [Arcicella lustrica]|uniref:Uncharacterized protein n=1 Tax=Arcicella lustrica TaxID=2984196 RepID=A0ABU5SDJ0_9BACT|nr:hypothetical protein [Arcicella sp. DC25W]MEA5425360.1 hypothetical protein [Arcicella sp. DC25W]